MKRIIPIILTIIIYAACNDHDSESTSAGADTTHMNADSLTNQPGTGYGNPKTDTVGVSRLGSATDTSGSLGNMDSSVKNK